MLLLLRIIGLIPGGRWLLRKCYAVEHPALEREVFGIRFANPIGLAAGFDHNGEAFRELAALGFGFVEAGTVTPRPQAGNPRPRVFRLPKDNAIINRIGLANRGLEATIRHLRRPHDGVIVGCNIGKNTSTPAENAPADYLKLFRSLYQYADYSTVNISCDNACREGTTHTREHILQILNPLFDFRRGHNQLRPIMLKISPDMSDEVIDQITDVLLETPLDGIVATNGTHSRGGLHTSRTTLEKIGSGRLSGAPLTHRAVEIVRRVHTRSGGTYPIIGVGGLMSAGDVRAMLDAGADLVQLYTGYVSQRSRNGQSGVPRTDRRGRKAGRHARRRGVRAKRGKPRSIRPGGRRDRREGIRRRIGRGTPPRVRTKITPHMKATIITIGDEILIGQIVDTNPVSIAKHLNAAGIVVREKISIGDDRTQIIETAERALAGSEVTVITGGLGPTKDDITKKSARVFLVMSSFVGPSPPVMTVTSEPARARSAVSMICVRSSPIEIFSRTTMPAALRCLAMETELVSTICPMSISSPMVMMVAFMCGVIFVRTRGGVPLPIRRRMPSRRSRRPPGRMLRGFPRFARTPRRRAWRPAFRPRRSVRGTPL